VNWPYQRPPDHPPSPLVSCKCGTMPVDRQRVTAVYEQGICSVDVQCGACGETSRQPATPELVRFAMTKPGQGGLVKNGSHIPASIDQDAPPMAPGSFRDHLTHKGA
jgi:hypothetical protein